MGLLAVLALLTFVCSVHSASIFDDQTYYNADASDTGSEWNDEVQAAPESDEAAPRKLRSFAQKSLDISRRWPTWWDALVQKFNRKAAEFCRDSVCRNSGWGQEGCVKYCLGRR